MDRDRFDRLSRLIGSAGTRRDALRAVVLGTVFGVSANAGVGTGEVEAARKRRKDRKRKARAEQIPLQCPITCNVNCSNKPLIPGSNLTKCNLNERDLDDINLSSANLTKACFGESSLRNARFRGANVSETCFCGADLTGADFRGTRVTSGQLGCAAKVACNTILPNGKPAVTCPQGQHCCDGECVGTGSDPGNCGGCGVVCGPCQFCNFGECEDLADGQFDCNRNPLVAVPERGTCTSGSGTGICDGGVCVCGIGGDYDPTRNTCVCGEFEREFCEGCCEIVQTCLEGSEYVSFFTCDCETGEPA